MALSPRFRRQVQRDGDVRMGARADAPQVHVGAFAPQIPQVDAVVNQAWVHDLGMRPGNALLVSTGIRTPLSIRKPLQGIVGRQASVTRMDAAARYGLDTSVAQTAFLVGRPPTRWGRSAKGARRRPDRAGAVLGGPHISTERCRDRGDDLQHRDVPSAEGGARRGRRPGPRRRDPPGQYGGCYVPKFIAGTTTLSNHAFGLAFDLNVPENLRGTRGRIDRQVVAIFESGASPGVGPGTGPTPCTSSSTASSTPADPERPARQGRGGTTRHAPEPLAQADDRTARASASSR